MFLSTERSYHKHNIYLPYILKSNLSGVKLLHTSGEQGSGDNLFGDNSHISGCPNAKLELVVQAKFMLFIILNSVGNGAEYFNIFHSLCTCESDVFAIYERIHKTANIQYIMRLFLSTSLSI